VEAYNQAKREGNNSTNALLKAWEKVKQIFTRDEKGIFSKRKT